MQEKNLISIRKKPQAGGKYVIKIEGKISWEGKDPRAKLPTMINSNPGKIVSISWKPNKEFLIV